LEPGGPYHPGPEPSKTFGFPGRKPKVKPQIGKNPGPGTTRDSNRWNNGMAQVPAWNPNQPAFGKAVV